MQHKALQTHGLFALRHTKAPTKKNDPFADPTIESSRMLSNMQCTYQIEERVQGGRKHTPVNFYHQSDKITHPRLKQLMNQQAPRTASIKATLSKSLANSKSM